MDVSEIIEKAWAAVEKAKVPSELRETAFREAVRLMTPQQAEVTTTKTTKARRAGVTPRPAKKRPSEEKLDSAARVADVDGFFKKLADETGVDRDKLEQVIHVDQGVPKINLVARRLGSTIGDRQIVVGQILPVARTYGMGEAETSVAVIRTEADRLHVLDTNINKRLADLDGITYGGPTNARTLKVRPGGVKAFALLVDRLLKAADEPQE